MSARQCISAVAKQLSNRKDSCKIKAPFNVLQLAKMVTKIDFFCVFEKLAKKYALVVMNYLGICLEYLRSVVCKFSPLGVLSGGTRDYFFCSF